MEHPMLHSVCEGTALFSERHPKRPNLSMAKGASAERNI